MTLAELYSELKNLGLADGAIYLHGLYGSTDDNEKFSLTIRKGKYSFIWEVYYKERGEKYSIREFQNEKDACQYYLKKIRESQLHAKR
ncbi:MAG: hypothetical protein ACPGYY_06695 [Bacteroidia bacterium]